MTGIFGILEQKKEQKTENSYAMIPRCCPNSRVFFFFLFHCHIYSLWFKSVSKHKSLGLWMCDLVFLLVLFVCLQT